MLAITQHAPVGRERSTSAYGASGSVSASSARRKSIP